MALPHDDYEAKLPVTGTITEDNFQKQVATVDEYRGDSQILYRTAQKYRTQLEEEGLDCSLIDDLIPRTNAFAVASSIRDNTVGNSSDAQELIAIKSDAYPFRRRLFNYGKFAFELYKDQSDALKEIITGSGDLDLADDFLNIHTLYSNNIDKFAELKKFSPALLEKGLDYQQKILDLYGKVNCPEDEKADLIRIERQMFAHMREAVLEIRRWARLTFADQPEVLEEFNTNYSRF